MYPPFLLSAIESALSHHAGKISIKEQQPVGGGCINRAVKIITTAGDFFVKSNSGSRFPDMFITEAKGLKLLDSTAVISVPKVITFGQADDESFIILEFVHYQKRNPRFWEHFGEALAQLHKHSAPQFGLQYDNYIGSLQQTNTQHDSWLSFFINERLNKQVQLAFRSNKLLSGHLTQFEKLYSRLPGIFPDEPPALLHGDLWSGNFITGADGEACIIDPAVYYGNREMEIAFTRLFGGFDEKFYRTYDEVFPLQKGFDERKDLYNLYPLLVHVNLFGGGYLSQVESILKSYL